MKRKVIKQGHNALTITLPSKWIKKNKINKDSEVDIVDQGKKLLVSIEKTEEIRKATIKIKNVDRFLKHYPYNYFLRSIDVLYRLGYDEIEIIFDNSKVLDYIHEELEFLLGFEIVNQGEKICIIRNIAQGLEKEFDSIMKRIFLMNISTAKDGFNAISNNEINRLNDLIHLEKINNKLTNFCERLLNKTGYRDPQKTSLIYSMLVLHEQIADDFKFMYQYLLRLNKGLSKATLNFYKKTIDFFELYHKLFYNFDREKLCNMGIMRRKLLEDDVVKLSQTQPHHELFVLSYLIGIINKIYHMTESLIEDDIESGSLEGYNTVQEIYKNK